tara:strand:+ start:566 stop:1558 length:993 start_codon:yes stop_codon:yes gene_type:complete
MITLITLPIILLTRLIVGEIDDFDLITIAILFLLNVVIILLLIISSIFKSESAKKFKIIGIMFINIPLVFLHFYLSSFSIFNTDKGYFYNYDQGEVIRPLVSNENERSEFENMFKVNSNEIKIAGNSIFTEDGKLNKVINKFFPQTKYGQRINSFNVSEPKQLNIKTETKNPIFYPIFNTEINDYRLIALSLDVMRPNVQMLILSFDTKGRFIDCVETIFFHDDVKMFFEKSGDWLGGAPRQIYKQSSFFEKYNNSGFTEIEIKKNKIVYRHSWGLKVYDNGSETIMNEYAECTIDENGRFVIENENIEKLIYYKDGEVNSIVDRKVKTQ